MNSRERQEFREVILGEIESQKHQIESLLKSIKPIAPDNAIGRLTRMEAIGSKGVSEASLGFAQRKLARLETALNKIENPEFGGLHPMFESNPKRAYDFDARKCYLRFLRRDKERVYGQALIKTN